MKTLNRLMSCLFSLAALTGPAVCDPAFGYLSGPVVHDNLAIYFVHGSGGGGAPLSLDQAMNSGQAQIRWTRSNAITVENLSDRSIFVPFGTLLTGGLQDQVIGASFMLPPHSGPVSLATFCVDPFRSAARDGESPGTLASAGLMFPGRMAKLAMLVAAPPSRAITRMRQSGVWWGIDTTRSQLARSLGAPVEPPREAHWNLADSRGQVSGAILAARESSWLTGLPLALESRALIEAQQAYVGDLEVGAGADGVIGAVFAVNGSLDGAEIYQSHALFGEMWPKLLRAHATEAIAAISPAAGTLPTLEAVDAFLASAQAGTARKQATQRATAQSAVLRDSDAAIFSETKDRSGTWIARSFVATVHPTDAAGTPEATLLGMLETGRVDGRSIASLGDRELVVLRRDASGRGWSAAIQEPEADRPIDAMLAGSASENLAAAAIGFALFALLFTLISPDPRARRSRTVGSRIGERPTSIETDGWRRPGTAVTYDADRVLRMRPQLAPPVTIKIAVLVAPTRVLAASLVAKLRRICRTANRLSAILGGLVEHALRIVAAGLGPALPANFRPAPRARARMTKQTGAV